jgi:hypothetical protein
MSSVVFKILAALIGGWIKVLVAKPKPAEAKPQPKKTAGTMRQEAMNSHRSTPL